MTEKNRCPTCGWSNGSHHLLCVMGYKTLKKDDRRVLFGIYAAFAILIIATIIAVIVAVRGGTDDGVVRGGSHDPPPQEQISQTRSTSHAINASGNVALDGIEGAGRMFVEYADLFVLIFVLTFIVTVFIRLGNLFK